MDKPGYGADFATPITGILITLIAVALTVSINKNISRAKNTSDVSKPNIHLANPPKQTEAAEEPTKEAAKEHLITVSITGTGEEFDGKRFGDRPLTWLQEQLTRQMRKVALSHYWKHAPLEDAETVGDYLIVVIVRGTGEFDGIYYRNEPLEKWEKELARSLIGLAEENGAECEPPPTETK